MGQASPAVRKQSGFIAGVLSFFIPGLGQLYKGKLLVAMFWFIVVGACWFFGVLSVVFMIPAAFMHFFCILHAMMTDPK